MTPPSPQLPPRVRIAALVAALGSGLTVILGFFAMEGAGFYPLDAAGAPPRALIALMPFVFFAFGAWGLATARGLLRLQPWSRISVLVFAGILAFMGAMGTIFLLSSKIPTPSGITPEQFDAIRGAVSVAYFLFLVIGVWWLTQFNSAGIRNVFRGQGEAQSRMPAPSGGPSPEAAGEPVREPARWVVRGGTKPPRPMSITVIGWYLLAGTVSSAVQVLLGVPALIFGRTLTGPVASLVYLAMFAMQAYLGIGLLQLQPLSRILSVCFFLLEFLNTVLFVALPGRVERLGAMLHSASGAAPSEISPPIAFGVLLISAGVMTALPVWFLVKRKDAFPPKPQP